MAGAPTSRSLPVATNMCWTVSSDSPTRWESARACRTGRCHCPPTRLPAPASWFRPNQLHPGDQPLREPPACATGSAGTLRPGRGLTRTTTRECGCCCAVDGRHGSERWRMPSWPTPALRPVDLVGRDTLPDLAGRARACHGAVVTGLGPGAHGDTGQDASDRPVCRHARAAQRPVTVTAMVRRCLR